MNHYGHGDIRTGNVSGQGIAIGHGAEASFQSGVDQELLANIERQLAELNALIDKHADDLDDPEIAREAIAAVEQELRAANPQPSRLKMLLSAVTGAASGISAITAAVAGVRGLLGLLI
jgi:hypothetical protein